MALIRVFFIDVVLLAPTSADRPITFRILEHWSNSTTYYFYYSQ